MLSRGAPAVEQSVDDGIKAHIGGWKQLKRGEPPKGNMLLDQRPHHRPEDYGREHFVVDNG